MRPNTLLRLQQEWVGPVDCQMAAQRRAWGGASSRQEAVLPDDSCPGRCSCPGAGQVRGASLDHVLPINFGFPRTSCSLVADWIWRTQTARPWRNPANIVFLRIRALLGTLERFCRSWHGSETPTLFLVDKSWNCDSILRGNGVRMLSCFTLSGVSARFLFSRMAFPKYRCLFSEVNSSDRGGRRFDKFNSKSLTSLLPQLQIDQFVDGTKATMFHHNLLSLFLSLVFAGS